MSLDRAVQVQDALDLAELYLDAWLSRDAIVEVEYARRLDPDDPAARLVEARALLRRAEPHMAMAALDVHDHLRPDRKDNPDVASLRAEALVADGRFELAIGLLDRLAAQFPDDVRFWRMLAAIHIKLGDDERAIAELRQVVRLHPTSLRDRCILAGLLEDDHPERAIALLETDERKLDDRARLRLARLSHRVDRLRDAEEHLLALLGAHPNDADLYFEAGVIADETGAAELAIRRLRRANRLRPNAPAVLTALAQARMHAGDIVEAGYTWWRLSRLHRHDPAALTGLLVCALAEDRSRLAGRIERQLEVHSSVAERRDAMARHWQHIAAPLLARPDATPDAGSPLTALLAEAAAKLEAASQQFASRADVQYHLAITAEALGRPSQARSAAECALKINPRYAAAQRLAARLHKQAA